MNRAITVGIVGTGSFAQAFIPLFQAHPLVKEVALCDLDAEKLKRNCEQHGIARSYPSLDALCESDVDAAFIITQNWLHAPQAVQALRAGKHVYSAVPTGITLEEIAELVRAVEETGKVYMLGETSSYYPAVLYCRERYLRGDFGHIVYSEAEYYHDWDHGLYAVMKNRGGERWREFSGSPPMHYPTHSTSQVLCVTGARMTDVSCQGFVDRADDRIYQADVNRWGNTFSNESALFRMSDGSICRINEFRRIGHPGAVRMSLLGTDAGFETSLAGSRWVTKGKTDSCTPLDDLLACHGKATEHGTFPGLASVHPAERLPREFLGLATSHSGSHQFLVDDFVKACASGETPLVNNVWMAARYAVPGIVAHNSAVQGGALLEVPDFGDPPRDRRP